MSDEEQAMLVCARMDEQPTPTPGSTITQCIQCGSEIWVSAGGMKVVIEQDARTMCFTCAQDHIKPGEKIEAAPHVEGELRSLLSPDDYAAVMEAFNEWRMERS